MGEDDLTTHEAMVDSMIRLEKSLKPYLAKLDI